MPIYLRAKYKWDEKGFEELALKLARASGTKVRVGVLGANASQKHPDSNITVGEIFMVNEFGSDDGHVPERSSLRSTFEKDRPLMKQALSQATHDIVFRKDTVDGALNHVGNVAVAAVRRTINEQVPPPNAPATVEDKGFNHPLINSGLMKNSVTHQLVRGTDVIDRGAIEGDYEAFSISVDD